MVKSKRSGKRNISYIMLVGLLLIYQCPQVAESMPIQTQEATATTEYCQEHQVKNMTCDLANGSAVLYVKWLMNNSYLTDQLKEEHNINSSNEDTILHVPCTSEFHNINFTCVSSGGDVGYDKLLHIIMGPSIPEIMSTYPSEQVPEYSQGHTASVSTGLISALVLCTIVIIRTLY